jgi:hypothetical protein
LQAVANFFRTSSITSVAQTIDISKRAIYDRYNTVMYGLPSLQYVPHPTLTERGSKDYNLPQPTPAPKVKPHPSAREQKPTE